MPRAAPEKHDLAKALDVTIRTLNDWEKRLGFPHGGTVEQINKWRDENGLGARSNPNLTALRTEKLAVETRLLKLKEAKEKRELIPFADAQAAFDRLLAKWHQLIAQKLEVETPARLVGKDITAARVEAKRIHDEIAETVNAQFGESTRELKP